MPSGHFTGKRYGGGVKPRSLHSTTAGPKVFDLHGARRKTEPHPEYQSISDDSDGHQDYVAERRPIERRLNGNSAPYQPFFFGAEYNAVEDLANPRLRKNPRPRRDRSSRDPSDTGGSISIPISSSHHSPIRDPQGINGSHGSTDSPIRFNITQADLPHRTPGKAVAQSFSDPFRVVVQHRSPKRIDSHSSSNAEETLSECSFRPHQNQSTETTQALDFDEIDDVEDDSQPDVREIPLTDIIPSTFKARTNDLGTRQPQNARSSRGRLLNLDFIRTAGHTISNVQMAVNERERTFTPTVEDKNFLQQYPLFTIDAKSVIGVWYSSDRPDVIQVQFPRKSNIRDFKVDLKFSQQSDGHFFLTNMEQWGNNIEYRFLAVDKMVKMFLNRENEKYEAPPSPYSMDASTEDLPEDLKMNAFNKKRKREVSSSHISDEQPAIRRLRSNIFKTPTHIKKPPAPSTNAIPERDQIATIDTLRPKRITRSITTPMIVDDSKSTILGPKIFKYSQEVGLGKAWKQPLVYPPAGKDRAIVDFTDIERLDDDEWLNDNIVMFYARYLEKTIQRNSGDKVLILNTFFHKQLTDNGGRKCTKINYDKVQKWTKVDIFEQDFVIVPICADSHWWMALICNLPNLAQKLQDDLQIIERPVSPSRSKILPETEAGQKNAPGGSDITPMVLKDDDATTSANGIAMLSIGSEPLTPTVVPELKKPGSPQALKSAGQSEPPSSQLSDPFHETGRLLKAYRSPPRTSQRGGRHYDPSSPVLLSLDSLGTPRSPDLGLLKDFIIEEGKFKRQLGIEKAQLSGMKAQGIPQQGTLSDCGVFLLAYLKKFLQNPREFATKLITRQMDDARDWADLDVAEMRKEIRDTIFAIHKEQTAVRRSEKRKSKSQTVSGSESERGVKSSKTIPLAGDSKVVQSSTSPDAINESPYFTARVDQSEKPPEASSPPIVLATSNAEDDNRVPENESFLSNVAEAASSPRNIDLTVGNEKLSNVKERDVPVLSTEIPQTAERSSPNPLALSEVNISQTAQNNESEGLDVQVPRSPNDTTGSRTIPQVIQDDESVDVTPGSPPIRITRTPTKTVYEISDSQSHEHDSILSTPTKEPEKQVSSEKPLSPPSPVTRKSPRTPKSRLMGLFG